MESQSRSNQRSAEVLAGLCRSSAAMKRQFNYLKRLLPKSTSHAAHSRVAIPTHRYAWRQTEAGWAAQCSGHRHFISQRLAQLSGPLWQHDLTKTFPLFQSASCRPLYGFQFLTHSRAEGPPSADGKVKALNLTKSCSTLRKWNVFTFITRCGADHIHCQDCGLLSA